MQNIRIVEFPPCRMVSSGKGMFGEEKFTRFHEWMSRQPQTAVYPENYLCGDGSRRVLAVPVPRRHGSAAGI